MDSQDHNYFDVLTRHIRLRPGKKEEIIRELEGHLEDKASDLICLGMSREAAERQALRQMGDPVALARQFQEAHTCVGFKELGPAVLPHSLVMGMLELGLWDSALAVAAALALIGGVTLLNWKPGNPSIRAHPWLSFTLGAPAIFLMMLVVIPAETVQVVLTGNIYPISTSLLLIFWGYLAAALLVIVCIVLRTVGRK